MMDRLSTLWTVLAVAQAQSSMDHAEAVEYFASGLGQNQSLEEIEFRVSYEHVEDSASSWRSPPGAPPMSTTHHTCRG